MNNEKTEQIPRLLTDTDARTIRFQEQPLPEHHAARAAVARGGVQPGPAREPLHPAEAGARHAAGEEPRLSGDLAERALAHDRRLRQLRHTKVLRVRHAGAKVAVGAKGGMFN